MPYSLSQSDDIAGLPSSLSVPELDPDEIPGLSVLPADPLYPNEPPVVAAKEAITIIKLIAKPANVMNLNLFIDILLSFKSLIYLLPFICSRGRMKSR
jgi:hypothetical protein